MPTHTASTSPAANADFMEILKDIQVQLLESRKETESLRAELNSLKNKTQDLVPGDLEAADIGKLTRIDGPLPLESNDKDRITEMKSEFMTVISLWSEHIGHLNRVNVGKWGDFFDLVFDRYPQLELILKRPETKPADFEGCIVDWGHVLVNQKIKEVALSFATILKKELSSPKHQSGLASTLVDVWSILKKMHSLKKESMQPVFTNYFRVCSNYHRTHSRLWSADEYTKMLNENFDKRLLRLMFSLDTTQIIYLYTIAFESGTDLQLSAALEDRYWNLDCEAESPHESIMKAAESKPGFQEQMQKYKSRPRAPGAGKKLAANLTTWLGDVISAGYIVDDTTTVSDDEQTSQIASQNRKQKKGNGQGASQ